MFRCEKSVKFEAAHELPHHDGLCKRLHGHSFVATIICEGEELCTIGPKRGMVIDFGDVKEAVAPLVEKYLDHHYLNETLAPFGITDPTSEEICRWLFNQLRPVLPQLVEIQMEETCTSRAIYRPSQNQSLRRPIE